MSSLLHASHVDPAAPRMGALSQGFVDDPPTAIELDLPRTRGHEHGAPLPTVLPSARIAADGLLDAGGELHQLKRYQILARVGEGGMGVVYRAHDPVLERDVALKVMKPDVPEAERRRFRQEALYGARFLHPGIVRVYDLGVVPGRALPWFAMEYLPGRDLEAILDTARARRGGGGLPLRLVTEAFRQVLAALQYAHDCDVVHRDVKPANMFVTRDPNTRFVTTKLLDFGVALSLPREGETRVGPLNTTSTMVCGDPRYMAPEQTVAGGAIDHQADIYAAGLSLYEVVTGVHPYADHMHDPRALLRAHREAPLPPPSRWLPGTVPAEVACGLDIVCAKACAKTPRERFASARDMQTALLDVMRL